MHVYNKLSGVEHLLVNWESRSWSRNFPPLVGGRRLFNVVIGARHHSLPWAKTFIRKMSCHATL